MYEAVVRMNDSRVKPPKLELFFSPSLTRDLAWQQGTGVVLRFQGASERWAGIVGLRTSREAYLWSNVTASSELGANAGCERSVSELLHQNGLNPRDRIPVHIDPSGDLVLDVAQCHPGPFTSKKSGPLKIKASEQAQCSDVSHSETEPKQESFPFGDRTEIKALAERYWELISPREYEIERKQIPLILEQARKCGHLDKNDFITLAMWKSPRPSPFYASNHWRRIRTQTAKALAADDRDAGLGALTVLAGVKLRTASAILHWLRPSDTPILDQRVVNALGREPPRTWDNIDYYRTIASEIIREARNAGVDLRTMDRALWAWDKLNS